MNATKKRVSPTSPESALSSKLLSGDVSRSIALAVDASPYVARRTAGGTGTAATYLPGERIIGVRLRAPDILEIHVSLHWGHDVGEATRQLRSALAPWWTHRIDLCIDDIASPAESATTPTNPVSLE